jgi:hypothetical protein
MEYVASATCLNEDSVDNLSGILAGRPAGTNPAILRSDCDEQLIMHFEFKPNEAAHVSGITLAAPRGGVAVPKSVQVFINARSLTFGSIDNFRPTDTVEIVWKPSDPSQQVAFVPLKKCVVHNAFQVSVFIPDNTSDGEDDVTVLSGVALHGEMAKGMGTTAPPQKG